MSREAALKAWATRRASGVAPRAKESAKQLVEQSPAQKIFRTAKGARMMTKWLISHSSKGGVKWQVATFTGKRGQESAGIVDMIAIRKRHGASDLSEHRGDLFEIILIQVKGGGAKFPSEQDVKRLFKVKQHHRADKVVLTVWKRHAKLCCYLLPNMVNPVPASEIFGKVPSKTKIVDATHAAAIGVRA
jgi:hypothetical protein